MMKQRETLGFHKRPYEAPFPWGRVLILYSFLFLLTCLLVYSSFLLEDKTLVMQGDAYHQHVKALSFFSRWLRDVLRHPWDIKTYSLSLGQGGDIWTTLHHYGLTEPLYLLSIFMPPKAVASFYGVMIVVRLYIAGLIFLALYAYLTPRRSIFASLVGALLYTFSGFSLVIGLWHAHFLSALISFPLLILGTEKVIREGKARLFIGSVFVAALCSIYFLYIEVLLLIIYYLWRTLPLHGMSPGRYAGNILRMILYGLIGVMMAGFVLLPVAYAMLTDMRTGTELNVHWLYSAEYYKGFTAGFLSGDFITGEYTVMGYGPTGLIAVIALLGQKKTGRKKRVLFLLTIGGLLLPFVGRLMNGMGYAVNRWIFAQTLFMSMIASQELPVLLHADRKTRARALRLCQVYLLIARLTGGSFSRLFLFQALILEVLLGILLIRDGLLRGKALVSTMFLVATLGSLFLNAYFRYAPEEANNVSVYVDPSVFQSSDTEAADIVKNGYFTSDAAAVASLHDPSFYRYACCDTSPERLYENTALLEGESGVQYYFSLSNGSIGTLMSLLAVADRLNLPNCYTGYDDRTMMYALAGVKYYVAPEGESPPYGYSRCSEANGPLARVYPIFENEKALPIVYTYDSIMPEETFMGLSPLERQEALMQRAVIKDEDIAGSGTAEPATFTGREIPFTLQKDRCKEDEAGLTAEEGAYLTLTGQGFPDGENYLYISGLETDIPLEAIPITVTFRYQNGETSVKHFPYYTTLYGWNKGQHDYLINGGYKEEPLEDVTLTFPLAGTYRLDEIKLFHQPMEAYETYIRRLREADIRDFRLYDDRIRKMTDRLSFSIRTEKDGWLCLAIPYSKGWQAFLDGKRVKVSPVNIAYCGFTLPAGDHDVYFRYRTPGLRLGCLISLVGFGLFLCIGRLTKKYRLYV